MNEPVLRVQNLCKRFGAVVACDEVSLELHAGEIHALIGPNGAGKSTLIQQLGGRVRPDRGQILLGHRDISELSVTARAQAGIALSFQVSMLIPGFSALQNVMLAVQGKSRQTFRFFKRALAQPDLCDKARTFLSQVGLLERESVPAAQLSHGERRKLELCMALALEPRVFVLDEPMAGMGSAGSAEMTQLLASLKSQAPILLVEHDMDAVFALADRISVLVYGRIIASGSVHEIRSDPDVREAYMGRDESLEAGR